MAQSGTQRKKLNSSSQNIKVVVRVRPLNNDEKEKRVRSVVQCLSLREIQTKEKKYHFDRVFEPNSSQIDIYSFVVEPMISDVLAGYNCTVFAYGQTGTGKTHTMTGGDPSLSPTLDWRKDERAGCIPRAAANIFDEIGSRNVTEYNVRVSFLELYNEEVRDLLSQDERPPPLNIFNDNKGSVCIQNLNEVIVFNSNDIYMLLQQGTIKRQTAATLMNNHSSRSHTVFTITVHIREAILSGEEVLKTGKLNLVDLAGSENIAKSGAKDKRAQELANINRSLLTLGRVIQILAEKNNKHVPYRDSKLTRILQDSLGGHTKTCIIATVSPSHTSYEETQSTLEYACRARDIRNTPMVNEKVTKAQMFEEMNHTIDKLRKDLAAARSGEGFFVDPLNWQELNSKLESNSNAITLKNEIIDEMKKKVSDLETVRDIKVKEFEDVMNVCKHKEKIIDKAKALLKDQHISLKQEQYVSRCYLEAATKNDLKAKELLEVTKNLAQNKDILHKKLENQYLNNYANEKIINEKSMMLGNNLGGAINHLGSYKNTISSSIANHRNIIDLAKTQATECAVNSRMNFENQFCPLIESQFEKNSELIREENQTTVAGLLKSQEEINTMLGLVNNSKTSCTTAYEEFQKYDELKSSNSSAVESLLTTLRGRLLSRKQKTESLLNDLERFTSIIKEEASDLDCMLNSIEQSKAFWSYSGQSVDEGNQKLRIKSSFEGSQESQEQLIKVMHETKNNLDLQRHSCLEAEQKLLGSSQDIKENINKALEDRLNIEKELISINRSHLQSLEENICNIDKLVDNHVAEFKTVLLNSEEMSKELVSKIIVVKRAGDTPKQNSLNFPKRLGEGTLTRDVLIKRFKEEFNEDIENESFHLNTSVDSVIPLDDSDDDTKSTETTRSSPDGIK